MDTQKVYTVSLESERIVASFTKIIINAGGTIIYTVAMFLLAVIAFMRILYLRGFIILAPLLILVYSLEKVGSEKIKGLDGISKKLSDS